MEENKEKTVKKRQECDPAYQWHIQDLYASDEAWEKDYESLTSEIQSLAAYEGRLKEGSEVFVEYMRKKEALMKKFEAIYVMQISVITRILETVFTRDLQVRRRHYPSS